MKGKSVQSLRITVFVDAVDSRLLRQLFLGADGMYGAYFDVFGDIPQAVIAATKRCRVDCDTATHMGRLGEYTLNFPVNEIEEEVFFTSTGRGVVIDAPSVPAAHAAWLDHMANVSKSAHPVSTVHVPVIRVYGEAPNALLPCIMGDGRAYADFAGIEAVPTVLAQSGLTFVVSATVAANSYRLGKSTLAEQPFGRGDRAVVTASGKAVSVSSTSLQFAYRVWALYLGGLPREGTVESQEEFTRLLNNNHQA